MDDPYTDTVKKLGEVFKDANAEQGGMSEGEWAILSTINSNARIILANNDPDLLHLLPGFND